MQKNAVNIVTSKRQRKLVSQKFKENNVVSFDLPAGEVIKRIGITVKGNVKYTFDTETPTPAWSYAGIAHELFKDITILTDGGITRKKVDVKWMRDQAKMINGSDAPTYSQENSSTLSTLTKGLPSSMVTTNQTLSFMESFEIPFEFVLGPANALSYLNLRSKNASVIEFNTKRIANTLLASDDGVDSYTHDIDIEVSLITAPHFVSNDFLTWRQTQKVVDFSGSQNSTPVQLNRGANICGLWLEVVGGQDRRPITLEEFSKCEFQLVRNGTEVMRHFNGAQLISENLSGTPLDDIIPACGYISFLNNKDFKTALKTGSGSGVQALDLLVTLPSDLSYTYPVSVKIKQDELVNLG